MRERSPRTIVYLRRAGLVPVGSDVIVHPEHNLPYQATVVAIRSTNQSENPAVILQIADGTKKVSIGGGTAVDLLR